MKITSRQLRRIINESMSSMPFKFSVNPEDYINKDQDVEDVNQMIRLILDSDEINYSVESGRNGYMFEFGYADDTTADPDPRSYQAFLTLKRILEKIGFPTFKDVMNDRKLRGKTYVHFGDSFDGNKTPVGDIFIKQKQVKVK